MPRSSPEPEAPRPRKRLSPLRILGLMLVAVFVTSLLAGYLTGGEAPAAPFLFYPFLGLLLVIVGWTSVAYWARLDEAAREAHKFAWYWGGSTGLALPAVVMLVLGGAGMEPFLWPGLEASPFNYMATGAMVVICAQVIGYALVWVGWWLWNSRS